MKITDEKSYYAQGFEYGIETLETIKPVDETTLLRDAIKALPGASAQAEFLLGVRDAKLDMYFKKLKTKVMYWSAGKTNAELSQLLHQFNDWLYRQGIIK